MYPFGIGSIPSSYGMRYIGVFWKVITIVSGLSYDIDSGSLKSILIDISASVKVINSQSKPFLSKSISVPGTSSNVIL